jgi:predicted nucleic acid-binding protein
LKVLVDSCAWSLALRRKDGTVLSGDEKRIVAVLVEAIKDSRAVLVGPVRQELLSGIKHVEQFEKLRERLEDFPDAAIKTADYVQAARLDNRCRAAGVQCGEVDMLLCAVAISNGWTILTNDTGLVRCIEIVEREVIETDPKRRGQRLLEIV